MRCGSAMWAGFNKELISKQMKRRVGGGLDTFYDNRKAPSTMSINQVTRTEPTGEQKKMDRNKYVDADHAREEKKGQGMA